MENQPTVSIVIPTYNRRNLLKRAIDSALNQVYSDFELLVIDDGSTDGTQKMVEDYSDGRVRLIEHTTNQGANAARNTGIDHAEGKYIAFLDSDDEWLPTKLERQVAHLESSSNEQTGVYCYHYTQDDKEGAIKKAPANGYEGDIRQKLLSGWCPASTSLFVIERDTLVSIGGFDPNLPSFQDYDMWARLSKKHEFGLVPEYLVIKHEHSNSQLSSDPQIRREGAKTFLTKWETVVRDELGDTGYQSLENLLLSDVYWKSTQYHFNQGSRRKAVREFKKYVRRTDSIDVKRLIGFTLSYISNKDVFTSLQALNRRLFWNEKNPLSDSHHTDGRI